MGDTKPVTALSHSRHVRRKRDASAHERVSRCRTGQNRLTLALPSMIATLSRDRLERHESSLVRGCHEQGSGANVLLASLFQSLTALLQKAAYCERFHLRISENIGNVGPWDGRKSSLSYRRPRHINGLALDEDAKRSYRRGAHGREAGGARRDGDDLSSHDRLVYPSSSLALGYRARARGVLPVDGIAPLARRCPPAEVRVIISRALADQEQQNEQHHQSQEKHHTSADTGGRKPSNSCLRRPSTWARGRRITCCT